MQVTKLFDKRLVLVKLSLLICNYSSESVSERMRPHPDVCKLISATELSSLCSQEVLCDDLQKCMADVRQQFTVALVGKFGTIKAKVKCTQYEFACCFFNVSLFRVAWF